MENNSSKLGLLKKALYIWAVQYHFVIPKEILATYIHKYKHERENIRKYGKRFYDPSIQSDYQKWLTFQTLPDTPTDQKPTVLYVEDIALLNVSEIQSEYVCLTRHDITYYPAYERMGKITGDVVYFDHDGCDENGRKNPVLKPDASYDTLHGFNYMGECVWFKTALLKQFRGKPVNVYRYLLELYDQGASFQHISQIVYCDNVQRDPYATLQSYYADHQLDVTMTRKDGCTVVKYPLMGNPLVSIVIPTKDGKDILKVCVDSILKQSTYQNFEILIADNNSEKEETFAYFKEIQEQDARVHVRRIETIFNFSLINNRMIFEHARGEYVVLLNNDTEIMTPTWVEDMLSYAQLDHVGSVGVKLYYEDDTIQHGGVISGKGGGFAHRYYRKPHDEVGYMHTLDVPNDVFACTAACLMIPMKKYREVGGMNEELTVQFNDVDLAIRLLEHGYQNVFLPNVCLHHYESKSRGIDKNQEAVDRYMWEVQYANEHYAKYIAHDPYYNDQFDSNYDYMLKVGTGSN